MEVIEIVKDYLDGGFTKEEVLKIVEHHYKKGEIEEEEYVKAKEMLEQVDETEKQKSATEQLSEKNAPYAKANIDPCSPAWLSPITPIKKD